MIFSEFNETDYFIGRYNEILEKYRKYACSTYAAIFNDNLVDYFIFAAGGSPKEQGYAHYSQFPALKSDKWFKNVSNRLWQECIRAIDQKNKYNPANDLWRYDPLLVNEFFGAAYREQKDKQAWLNSFVGEIDETGIVNLSNKLTKNPYLADIFKKKTGCQNLKEYCVLAGNIRTLRNKSSHNTDSTVITKEEFSDTLNKIKKVINVLKNEATSENRKQLIARIDEELKLLDFPTLTFEDIKAQIPTFNSDLLVKLRFNVDTSKQEIYYTDINLIKEVFNTTQNEHTEEDDSELNKNFQQLHKFLSQDKLGIIPKEATNEIIDHANVYVSLEAWLNVKQTTDNVVNGLIEQFANYRKTIFTTKKVREELRNIAYDPFDEQSAHAKKALDIMHFLHGDRLISYVDFHYFGDVENEIFDVSSVDRETKNIVITTPNEIQKYIQKINDNNLNNLLPVLAINKQFFVSSAVKDIGKKDTLYLNKNKEKNISNAETPVKETKTNDKKADTASKVQEKPKFNTTTTYKKPLEEIGGNTIVFNNKGEQIQLLEEIAHGGEGIIYKTNFDKKVAKIYFLKSITEERYNKLSELTKLENRKTICLPNELLYTKDGEFIGFLMRKVSSEYKPLQTSIFKLGDPSVQESKQFSNWNRINIINTCINICENFSILHNMGILMGDVNPDNILVNTTNADNPTVCFVDCDSMQYKNYNCPVGQLTYTDPQIYLKYGDKPEFSKVTRTINNELYAIALILFKCLFFNASPFIGKGNVDVEHAMKTYNFAYRSEASNGSDTADGANRLIWNNLPKYIKDKFVKIFVQKGYVQLNEWKSSLNRYRNDMKKGIYTSDLIPTLYWDNANKEFNEYFTCVECGQPGNMPKERYANNAKFYGAPLQLCSRCYDTFQGLDNNPEIQKYANNFPRNIVCQECERTFVTNSYKDAYLKNVLRLPMPYLRCDDCKSEVTIECEKCGNEYSTKKYIANKYHKHICPNCRENVGVTCKECGKQFKVPKWKYDEETRKGHDLLCSGCLKERLGR